MAAPNTLPSIVDLTAQPSWSSRSDPVSASGSPSGHHGGSFIASLAQSSPLTWFTCGLTALVGPRSRRGITGAAAGRASAATATGPTDTGQIVDTQPGHIAVVPPIPSIPAPPPAITIDSSESSPPLRSAAFSNHLSLAPSYDTVSPPSPISSAWPQPPVLASAAPVPTSKPSSRWTSLSRVFQSLAALRLSADSAASRSSRLAIPTHFPGRRRAPSRRSNSLHHSPTASSFSQSSSVTSSQTGTGTLPVKPHAMLLPDSPLDREYALWCSARDARAWIVVALGELGLDPQAPVGVASAQDADPLADVGLAQPASPRSFQSSGASMRAPTLAEGLVQCVVQSGIEVDLASAEAAPVGALRALVAVLGSVIVEDQDRTGFQYDGPVGFVTHPAHGSVGMGAVDLSELAVVALKEVLNALRALRSPPPLYTELDHHPNP